MQHPFSDLLVIVNPQAGGGKALRLWQRMLAVESGLNDVPCICDADHAASQQSLRRLLKDRHYNRLLVLGGDGTVHGAVAAILEAGLGKQITLVINSSGTGSDFAKALGLATISAEETLNLLNAQPKAVDAIAVTLSSGEHYYVANIASTGLSGETAWQVNQNPGHGPLAYATVGLRCAWQYPSPSASVWVDDAQVYAGPLFLFAAGNSRHFGNGMRITPMADVHDGILEIAIVQPVPRWQLPWRLLQLLRGTITGAPQYQHFRGARVRLESEKPVQMEMDGEVSAPFQKAEINVIPGALRLALPAGKAS